MPRSRPRVIDDHDGVVQVRPGHDLIALVAEALPAGRVGLALGGALRSIGLMGRPEKFAPSLGVRATAARLPSTNSERKYQRPAFTSGTSAVHNGPLAFLPAGDRHAAGEDRLFVRISRIRDRGILRARVLGRKLHRLATRVLSAAQQHDDRLAERAVGLQPADRIAGARQAGQGAIAAVGLRRGQAARPRIFAVRRHEKVGRRHVGSLRTRCHRQQKGWQKHSQQRISPHRLFLRKKYAPASPGQNMCGSLSIAIVLCPLQIVIYCEMSA